MKQKFNVNNSDYEKIIEQLEEASKDLEEKIKIFTSTLGNTELKLNDDIKTSLEDVISKLESDKGSIDKFIERVKQNGISSFRLTTDDRNEYQKMTAKQDEIDKRIANLSNIGPSDNKFSQLLHNLVEKKIESLKLKKGKMQNKQLKIVSKAVKEKLRSLMKNNSYELDMLHDELQYSSEKVSKINEVEDKLQNEKATHTSEKNVLLADKGLEMKVMGVGALLNEKLTGAKIASLRLKKGIINSRDRHIVIRGVKPSLVQKMKDKVGKTFKEMKDNVSYLGEALDESFKAGVDKFKSFYGDISPEPVPSKSR